MLYFRRAVHKKFLPDIGVWEQWNRNVNPPRNLYACNDRIMPKEANKKMNDIYKKLKIIPPISIATGGNN
jgi:hypothetical protein